MLCSIFTPCCARTLSCGPRALAVVIPERLIGAAVPRRATVDQSAPDGREAQSPERPPGKAVQHEHAATHQRSPSLQFSNIHRRCSPGRLAVVGLPRIRELLSLTGTRCHSRGLRFTHDAVSVLEGLPYEMQIPCRKPGSAVWRCAGRRRDTSAIPAGSRPRDPPIKPRSSACAEEERRAGCVAGQCRAVERELH